MSAASRRTLVVAAAVAAAVLGAPAVPAAAHPLGNFSVNQYAGLTLFPDRVRVAAAVNTAEIPTAQDRSTVDSDGDGTASDAERAAHAAKACGELAGAFEVRVGGERLGWTVTPGEYRYAPGTSGLATAMLTCTLDAPARLGAPATVGVVNRYFADRVGWHELTATGEGLHLVNSPLPDRSSSDELRAYPPVPDPGSVLNVRTATLRVEPGARGAAPAARPVAPGDPVGRATWWAERSFERLSGGRLTPLLAALAVLLALLLGAGHAALPGHGKTVLAAYLAGRAGRPRDAVVVGATVTATHTVGVLAMGLLLTTVTALAGERLLGYLAVASGVLIVAVGVTMLVGAARRGAGHRGAGGAHEHALPAGRLGLAGMGVAGGLVPSPSALVVLLAAVGLGRAVFGVLLVVAYGLGMAATLTAAGLLLLAVQRRVTGSSGRLGRLGRLAARVPRAAPLVTAGVVLIVGAGLAIRAAAALG